MADPSTRDGRSLSARGGGEEAWSGSIVENHAVDRFRTWPSAPAKRKKGREREDEERRVVSVHSWIAWNGVGKEG